MGWLLRAEKLPGDRGTAEKTYREDVQRRRTEENQWWGTRGFAVASSAGLLARKTEMPVAVARTARG